MKAQQVINKLKRIKGKACNPEIDEIIETIQLWDANADLDSFEESEEDIDSEE